MESFEYNLENFPFFNRELFIHSGPNIFLKKLFSPLSILREITGGHNVPIGLILISIIINPKSRSSSKNRSTIFVILNCILFLAQKVFLLVSDREHKRSSLVILTVLPMLFELPTYRCETSDYFASWSFHEN